MGVSVRATFISGIVVGGRDVLQREEDSVWFRYDRPSGQPHSDTLKCMGESWAGYFPHIELKIPWILGEERE